MVASETPVLIADDSPHMCRLLASYLGDLGLHDVTLVANGEAAVDAAGVVRYGLVFLDIEMPGIDGLTALQAIRAIDPEANVVIISSQGTLANVKTAIQLGAKGFLVKPYTKQKVDELVHHLLKAPAPGR